MQEEFSPKPPLEVRSLLQGPAYLSVRETAHILGLSERSVYGYIKAGKLPGMKVDNLIVTIADAVYTFKRRAPGRVRKVSPRWRLPPLNNNQYITFITARVRPGQGAELERKLLEMREEKKHCLPGTSARYIARNQEDPDEIDMVFIWRGSFLPPEDERQRYLAAFFADFAGALEWETALWNEGNVLIHAG